MTTFDSCTVPSHSLATDHGTTPVRDTLRRLGRWALEELRDGAEMSARRDAARAADERRFLERP